MATKPRYPRFKISTRDESAMLAMRTVLAYEASIRNRSRSQAAYEIVMESVDIDSYPDVIRSQIDEASERLNQRAIAQFLEQSELD